MATEQYQQRIQKVLDYIKGNLTENISVAELAEVACFSAYHFHRIFSAYAGEPLYAYIRRLRIQKAIGQLVYSDASVTDIAFDCGFESQASFNKAFKQLTGMAPTRLRQQKRSDIQLSVQKYQQIEGKTMKPEIVTLKPRRILFVSKVGDYNQTADVAWQELIDYAQAHGLLNDKTQYYGVPHDNPKVVAPERQRYDACITIDDDVEGEAPLQTRTMPGGKYAVFQKNGFKADLTSLFNTIFAQWYPNSGYELRDEPNFMEHREVELYESDPQAFVNLVHIPIE